MINEIRRLIEQHEDIVILGHKKPDGDAIGSSVALSLALKKINKNVILWQKDDSPREFSFLTKDFVYKDDLLPQIGSPLYIFLDSSDSYRFDDRITLPVDAPTICIDHHMTNEGYADINYIVPSASSTGELVFNVLENWVPFDENIATALYVAIASDTHRFFYETTHQSTFVVSSKLYPFIKLSNINYEIFAEKPLDKLKLDAWAIDHIELVEKDKVAICVLPISVQSQYNCYDTDGIVEQMRNIQGIEVAVLLYEYKDEWKMSLRSKYTVDVSKVAKYFGGGGHERAAGATIEAKEILQVKKNVITLLGKHGL